MRFIPTRFHGILDYVVGALLIVSPWLFGFSEVEAAMWVAVIAGAVVLMQTIITDFEVGLMKTMSMGTHLTMDVILGIIVAVSPWLFGFAQEVYWPHLIIGVYLILASFTTHRVPSRSYQRAHAENKNTR